MRGGMGIRGLRLELKGESLILWGWGLRFGVRVWVNIKSVYAMLPAFLFVS